MIPFLPELSVPPGAPAPGVLAQPGAGLREAGTLPDFAGLLEAALPESAANVPGELAAAAPPPPLQRELPAMPAIRLPEGSILPESGSLLPQGQPQPEVQTVPDPALPPPAMTAASETDPQADPALQDGVGPVAMTIAAVVVPVSAAPAPPPPAPATLAAVRPIPRAAIGPVAAPPRSVSALREPSAPADAVGEGATASAASAAPAPAPAALLADASAPAPPHPAPSAAAVPLTPTATPLAATDRSEPRAPAPQLDSAIAQVGEIREALRAGRPELTLRHAEFGFVSLRLEATGAQDWRAVLASRDPGFVPAIQAALAERAIAASADTSGTGSSSNQAGHGAASEQRYGSSPNSGQGSSSPYFGHAANRDGDGQARPQHRQPDTTATVATRAGEREADEADQRTRGLFA